MTDVDSSSAAEHRKKLREKIRAKRDKRLGMDDEDEVDDDNGLLHIQDGRMKEELSKRVETELKKVFGMHPEAMEMAQQYINDPMTALKQGGMISSNLSKEEKEAVESLVKLSDGDEDEEAPPST